MSESQAHPLRILVVDDNLPMLRAMARLLRGAGYAVCEAANGQEAMALVHQERPDLILMDVVLPDADGVELAQRIKQDPELAPSPPIWSSVVVRRDESNTTRLGAGADGYIARPIENREMLARVEAYGRIHAHRAELRASLETARNIVQSIPSGLFIYQFRAPDSLTLVDANPAAESITGVRLDEWQGREFLDIWPQAIGTDLYQTILTVMETGQSRAMEELEYADGRIEGIFTLRAFAMPGKRLGVAFESVTERVRSVREREHLIAELKGALAKVKQLSGLLPICASCKRIRDDGGYWHQVEVYVHNHSEAEFSHSLCPDCMRKLYPDLDV